jgi:hypothetical protein
MNYSEAAAEFLDKTRSTDDLIGTKEEVNDFYNALSPDEKKKFKLELMKQIRDKHDTDEKQLAKMRQELGIEV